LFSSQYEGFIDQIANAKGRALNYTFTDGTGFARTPSSVRLDIGVENTADLSRFDFLTDYLNSKLANPVTAPLYQGVTINVFKVN